MHVSIGKKGASYNMVQNESHAPGTNLVGGCCPPSLWRLFFFVSREQTKSLLFGCGLSMYNNRQAKSAKLSFLVQCQCFMATSCRAVQQQHHGTPLLSASRENTPSSRHGGEHSRAHPIPAKKGLRGKGRIDRTPSPNVKTNSSNPNKFFANIL